MFLLLELYEQFVSQLFLWSITSIKKLLTEGKLWLKNLAGMSSRICNIIPRYFITIEPEQCVEPRTFYLAGDVSQIENFLGETHQFIIAPAGSYRPALIPIT